MSLRAQQAMLGLGRMRTDVFAPSRTLVRYTRGTFRKLDRGRVITASADFNTEPHLNVQHTALLLRRSLLLVSACDLHLNNVITTADSTNPYTPRAHALYSAQGPAQQALAVHQDCPALMLPSTRMLLLHEAHIGATAIAINGSSCSQGRSSASDALASSHQPPACTRALRVHTDIGALSYTQWARADNLPASQCWRHIKLPLQPACCNTTSFIVRTSSTPLWKCKSGAKLPVSRG